MVENNIYDYIIVGAGILGCATAAYLKESLKSSKILLLDKYSSCGQGNTSKSNACYRNVFDTELNIQLCNASIDYYKEVQKKHDIGLKEVGYLWLLNEEQMRMRKEKRIEIDNKDKKYSLLDFLDLQKVKYKIYNQEEIKKLFPSIKISATLEENECEIKYGLLGHQCGTLGPDLLVKYYEEKYRELGGECVYGYEVQEVIIKGKRKDYDQDYFTTVWRNSEVAGIKVLNLKTKTEETLKSKNVVLCTGAWINQLLYKLGIHIGVNAKKRQLFRINNKKTFVINNNFTNVFQAIPFIILPLGGVFIKPIPENGSVDVGCSDDLMRRFEREPDLADKKYDPFKNNIDNPHGDLEFYQTDVLPVLQSFFPSEFNEKVKIEHPSAGMYAYSLDKFPIITKELGNLYICTGASGSGIMKGDAIARINVANILNQKECTLFNGLRIGVKDFSLHERKVPQETLIL